MEHLFHFSYPQIYLESKYPEENKIIFRVNRHRFMQHEQIKVEDWLLKEIAWGYYKRFKAHPG